MIVGTAGHIDHGKTALVKALTGVDADRLKEEKARGITIDLGYAYSDLGDGRQLGFVDVPGHERFVHNMLAGVTGIDAALLVVSAAEGIKPQTVEHLQIVDLLGLDRGIVALTKSDLVTDDQMLERMAEIETLLSTTSLKGAEIIPVSAMTGQGLDELKAKLLALGESRRGITGFARLAVDRCFVLSGAGVVVTGTVHAGEIRVDDHVLLTPSGLEARVRSLHAQNRAAEVGRAGERCALNLSGAAPVEGLGAARRLGGERRAACADRPHRRAAEGAGVGDAAAEALVAGACPSRRGPRHGPGRAARRRQAGAGQRGAGAARARGEGRRAGGRPHRAARSLGHAHHRGRRGDRSVRTAAQPAHAAPSGRGVGAGGGRRRGDGERCCGSRAASSRPRASASRATSGPPKSTGCWPRRAA